MRHNQCNNYTLKHEEFGTRYFSEVSKQRIKIFILIEMVKPNLKNSWD